VPGRIALQLDNPVGVCNTTYQLSFLDQMRLFSWYSNDIGTALAYSFTTMKMVSATWRKSPKWISFHSSTNQEIIYLKIFKKGREKREMKEGERKEGNKGEKRQKKRRKEARKEKRK